MSVDVFMNDIYVGKVDDHNVFIDNIKSDRQKGKLPAILNISYNERLNEVNVETSNGRARRPVIVVENGAARLTEEHRSALEKGEMSWKDLIGHGIIEYLDAAEEENCLVALNEADITPDHTHLNLWSLCNSNLLS